VRVGWIRALVFGLAVVFAGCGTQQPSSRASPTVPPAPSPTAAACVPSASDAAPPDLPWWTERTFYEVFVRSYADSDGDGIGDLRGLTDRLDHLNDGDPATTDDLGVTGIWLMPVAESPSYHGYDVTDYEAVEPDYGTAEDFATFLDAAHDRGIAVIVDLVINHTSVEHPWFEASRDGDPDLADWYVWSDEHGGFGGPGGRQVWHAAGERYYYGYFWEGMPDLNLANDAVTAELQRIAAYWIEDMGVDGFRLDAARHLIEDGEELENTPETRAWLVSFRERVHASRPDALVLGEVWDATSTSARYVHEGSLDLAFEFGLASAFVSAVRFGDPASLAAIQAEVTAAYPPRGYASFLTNHDQDRVFDQVGRDMAAARAAASLLLTSAGVPFIYYGEEIGMRGRKPDERIRTPLAWDGSLPGAGFTTGDPWQDLADGLDEANIAVQTADPGSLLSHYRTLIRARSESPALLRGDLRPVTVDAAKLYAIARHLGDEMVIVVVNLGEDAVAAPALSLDSGPLCGRLTAQTVVGAAGGDPVVAPDVTADGGFTSWQPVDSLGPWETLIVRLSP
jgi:glycosidase